MERKGRNELKEIFSRGSLPTERHFRTLIDSLLNLEDDDFQSLLDGPLKIYSRNDQRSPGSKKTVLEFFRAQEDTKDQPVWKFTLNVDQKGRESLHLVNSQQIEVLSISPSGEVTINSTQTLIKGSGYLAECYGNYYKNCAYEVEADGAWHSVITKLTGCQAFEVMASTGNKYTPKSDFAITKATALLVPSPKRPWDFFFPEKNKIHMLQNHSGSSRNKIDFRWLRAADNSFSLQTRTRRDYKGNTKIRCRMLKTFSHDFMEENKPLV